MMRSYILWNGDIAVNFDWSQVKASIRMANAKPPPSIIPYPDDWGR